MKIFEERSLKYMGKDNE